MFNLNCYFVSVGQNYCKVLEGQTSLNLKDAFIKRDVIQLKIMREFITRTFKRKYLPRKEDEFKMVFVKKEHLLSFYSYVEDTTTKETYEPFVSTKAYDVFIIKPTQELTIEYQVVRHEIEHRNLPYDEITVKHKRKTKKYQF